MINLLIRNTGRFIVLVLLQVLLIDHMQISGYIQPFFYVIFILLLPFETPGWLVLVSAFFLGLSIDFFENTPGLHASATVFMGFLRPGLLKLIAPRDGYEPQTYPRIFYYGTNWFVKYSLILIFAHHLMLFFLEVFTMTYFFETLLRVFLSTIFSFVLIVLSQFLIYRK